MERMLYLVARALCGLTRPIAPGKKSRPVRLANEPAAASGDSDALLYSPMDEDWGHFFASSFFIASWDIASSFFMAS